MPGTWSNEPGSQAPGTTAPGADAPRTWFREVVAGGIGAMVLFAIAVPVGVLALAPLGPAHTGLAVAAGLASGVVATLAAAVAGGNPAVRTGPMTAVGLVLASVLASLAALPAWRELTPSGLPVALAGGLAAMALGGVVQVALGASRVGNLVNFTPLPVLAGFRNGVALLIIAAQVPVFLGHAGPFAFTEPGMLRAPWLPWTLLAGLLGIVAIAVARWFEVTSLAPVVGILAATAAAYGLHYLGGVPVGPRVGPLPSIGDLAGAWRWAPPPGAIDAWPWMVLVGGALSMALVGAVLTLMAAKAMEGSPLVRSDGDRLLRGQGIANVAAALAGGVPVAGSIVQSRAMQQAGGRTWMASIVAAFLLAVAAFLLRDAIAHLPLVALASVIVVIGWDMLDRETVALAVDALRPGSHRKSRLQDLLVIVVVAAASVAFDVVVGVVTGIVVAVLQFAVASSNVIVRRRSSGAFRRSLHVRSEFESRRLDHAGAQTAIFELQGALFFGTADGLALEVTHEAANARYVICDLTRVHTVDATGAHLLRQMREHLRERGGELLLAGWRERTPVRSRLLPTGGEEPHRWFPDVDRALEWCEAQVLAELTVDTTYREELAFARTDLCHRLEPELVTALEARMERAACPAGTRLFRQGARGDEIFVLVHGRVSLILERDDGLPSRRLATFGPGAVFGEMAVLEARVRTSMARCDTDVVVWKLTRAALRTLAKDNPVLGVAVYRALARILSARLRESTRELRDLSDP